jgi:uncharacterized membrane protein
MNRKMKIVFMVPLGILAMALFVFVGGEIVQHLWNWLLPGLFGWHLITFWQALGLLILCRILFGGFGMHGPRGPKMRGRMKDGCEPMTPEERERVRERMRERFGFGPSPTESKGQG